ncbi:hypothetical protein SeLEV6574_g00163 [Synchytrium endobioticum]|uniref:Uncharacterized protein n=1 Tax=Synchytrium endobioticum TaxID=286115 RepID=A0A507DJD4_9FUNG|nr:hypothetical protein SeLEV6574_g00163 [Synchytrium endobioticum]
MAALLHQMEFPQVCHVLCRHGPFNPSSSLRSLELCHGLERSPGDPLSRYASKISLFIVGFFVIFAPASLNRILNMVGISQLWSPWQDDDLFFEIPSSRRQSAEPPWNSEMAPQHKAATNIVKSLQIP